VEVEARVDEGRGQKMNQKKKKSVTKKQASPGALQGIWTSKRFGTKKDNFA